MEVVLELSCPMMALGVSRCSSAFFFDSSAYFYLLDSRVSFSKTKTSFTNGLVLVEAERHALAERF